MSPQHKSSLQPLLDAAIQLTRCDPKNKKYSAPVCSFVWGNRQLKSCVVKSFDFNETMWNGDGYPVHAEGTMTLLEVLDSSPTKTTTGSSQQTQTKLTNRELESGSKGAADWIKNNPLKLPTNIQQRVGLGQYKIQTDIKTRAIAITDSNGKVLSVIGTNERGVFKSR